MGKATDEGVRPSPGSWGRGYVDYERMAGRYHAGRSLSSEVLERWRDAVRPHVSSDLTRLVDVGAGTGIFAAAWSDWTAASVVAVEPSMTMIAARDRAAADVTWVRGVAEALPLQAATAQLVWVSAALHHFGDIQRAIAEFARVLDRDGRVLVRTYAPGRSEVSWVTAFPGRANWEARFLTESQLRDRFAAQGFALCAVAEVLESRESFGDSARWAEGMRYADSMLTALSDREVEQGLQTLRSQPDEIGRVELTLFVFGRP